MNIGSLELEGRTVLAPLAGVTNLPFRLIVKECGCALVCSEMVSAKGLLHDSGKTYQLLKTTRREAPLSVQIFGADPGAMAEAAGIIQETGGAAVLDINFGCSVRKVVKQGAGVALMRDIRLAEKVVRAVRKAITIPFMIKIRSGWDSSGCQAFEIARMAQDAGVDAIAFHPRTASQGFKGRADWDLIRRLKQELSIPLIGNGDINTPEDGARMAAETGCDAVMVGRAAMGNPFIFSGIEALFNGELPISPSRSDIFRVMEKLINYYVDYFGETIACKMMRGRLTWFVKGLPGCGRFRRQLTEISTREEALGLIREYEAGLL